MPTEGRLGPSRALRSPLETFLGPSWTLLTFFWALLDPLGALLDRLGALLDLRGALLDPLGALLDRLGALLDRLGALLDPLWALLDRLGALLGPPWRFLGAIWEPSATPSSPERQLFGALRALIAWTPGRGPDVKGGGPTGLPECHPFAMEICRKTWICPQGQLWGPRKTTFWSPSNSNCLAPRAGTGCKGGDPTGLPECRPFIMEICKEMALPTRSTLGTSKNNFLEPFEP